MAALTPIEIGLTAAIVAVEDDEPAILVAGERVETPGVGVDGREASALRLPTGPFDPLAHGTFEQGLREWVAAQTGLTVGYVEQLYTFGDRGRHARPGDDAHVVSIGYLALTRMPESARALTARQARFEAWYRFFPWEDWREARPEVLDSTIIPLLDDWAGQAEEIEPGRTMSRRDRLRLTFGVGGSPWDEEKVLDRYELIYEAGLIEEARRDGRKAALARDTLPELGIPMRFDHRRILATAIARLRGKLKYRPVVFELMPAEFTLTQLQHTVEAISGRHLHKQNFRRLVENAALVEPTGETSTETGGRPAAIFRFRREVLAERPAAGLRLGGRN